MIIRRLREDENGQLSEVESLGFLYSANVREAAEEPLKSEVYGAFTDDDQTLMSAIYTPEYHSWCGEITLPSVGIGGVATRPEYRRGGAIRGVFEEIFRLAPEKNWVTSTLYPFSFDYYRQFGYERVFKVHTVTMRPNVLAKFPRNNDAKLYSFRNPEMKADILEVYNTYAKRHGLMYRRDEKTHAYSDDPYKTRRMTYVHYNADGKADACAVLCKEDANMTVKNLAYLDAEGLKGFLGFLRAFDGQIEEYVFNDLPSTEELDAVVGNYIDVGYDCDSCGMGRILLLETLLKNWVYPSGIGHFRLRCDDFLEWNRAVWDVSYANGKGMVTKLPYDADYDISAAIAPLSRFIMEGGYSVRTASYLDGAEIRNADCIETEDFFRAFPAQNFYIHDRF